MSLAMKLALTVCATLSFQICEAVRLKSGALHTFQNRHDHGFLTAVTVRNYIVTDIWRDAATQKWRADKAYTSDSYQLKPSYNEDMVAYLDSSTNTILQGSEGFGLSSDQYWYPTAADKGFVTFKNLSTKECLESNGLGQRVGAARCKNTPKQQWAMHIR